MKYTKRILSALLTLCMVFGCLAVGFSAQAATLPAVIDGDYTWTGGDVTLADTLKIVNTGSEAIKVDLGNATLTGPAGKPVVQINGNVEVFNGTFIAQNGDYSGETGFIKTLMDYQPAVNVVGGTVVLNCVTAVGSLIRIPNSNSIEVTAGNGVRVAGADVTLKHVIACGMKALDNESGSVVVEDAILVGIYKAANVLKNVQFADGYEQYKTVDFLKGLLKDGVSLTATEEKVISSLTNSEGELSVASVIANIKAPVYGELTHEFSEGVLKVYAQADVNGSVAGVPNRYSYQYTPDTCTIGDVTVPFEAVDGAYVATFDGIAAGESYEATADYKLAVKLGNKQASVLENALDTAAAYVERAPELLYRFIEDFEKMYAQIESYLVLINNAKYDTDSITNASQYFDDADMKKLFGILLSLIGEDNVVDTEGRGGYVASRLSYYKNSVAYFNNLCAAGEITKAFAYTESKDITSFGGVGYFESSVREGEMSLYYKRADDGHGVGILEQFDEYYDTIKALVYPDSTTEWDEDGIVEAAQYVGDNWEEMLELVEAASVVLKAGADVLQNMDTGADSLLTKVLNGMNISSYVGYLDTAIVYVDKIMSRVDDLKSNSYVEKYGDVAGEYCARYAQKALNIMNNLDSYFELNVADNFVTLSKAPFEFQNTQTIEVESAKKMVRVDIQTSGSGYGYMDLGDGESFSTSKVVWYEIGSDINLDVAAADGSVFAYMAIETNGNATFVDGASYSTKAATNLEIKVCFVPESTVTTTVTYMTDAALNYKYIASEEYVDDAIEDELADDAKAVKAYAFVGLEHLGWSLDKNGEAKTMEELASELVLAAQSSMNVFVYAIYEEQGSVTVPVQENAVEMTDVYADSDTGRNYFEITVQVPDGYKAIEAGVIATKNADLATEEKMIIDLSGTTGVVFGRVTKKDADGYVVSNIVYTYGVKATGTVYARGYVVLVDANNDVTVVYTDIAESSL